MHAAADAVKAGNDLVMTTPGFYDGAIEAVHTGLLDESLIDEAVARILALKFRLGLFEDPRLPDAEAHQGRHRLRRTPADANLELARESVALLRNDGGLPFDAAPAKAIPGSGDAPARKRIAVVGPLADDAQNQLGDWTGNSGQVVLDAGWPASRHDYHRARRPDRALAADGLRGDLRRAVPTSSTSCPTRRVSSTRTASRARRSE